MVARTPPKEKVLMVAPHSLDATQIRQTLKKVDQCMARLQELQYTVNGGKKVVCGVNLSPLSTRAYMKTSLRCKQESIRMKTNSSNNVNGSRKSPVGKLPRAATGTAGGEWRRMSLPAMLVGETVGEILQASKFARDITETINKFSSVNSNLVSSSNEDPKTPLNLHKKQRDPRTPVKLHQRQIERQHNPENSTLESRRKREKQHKFRVIQPQSNHNNSSITPPSCRRRARSRINFKVSPPKKQQHGKENRTSTILNAQGVNHQSTTASSSGRYSANRVSPKHKPWAKKTVLFPNPLFHSTSPTSSQQQNHKIFCNKTNSPIIGKKNKQQVQQTPHKFLIKSPPQKASLSKSPPRKERVSSSSTKFQVKIKTPPKISPPRPKFTAAPTERGRLAERGRNPSPSSRIMSTASRLRRSLSPARLANRLVSPLRSRKTNVQKSTGGDDDEFMAGMKRRNSFMSMRFSTPRIIV